MTSTTSLPATAPVVEPARISVAKATALILGAHLHDGLPYPYGIGQNGGDSDLLCLQFQTHAEVRAWHKFFGVNPSEPSISKDGQRSILIDYGRDWNGWTVGLYGFEPLADTCGTPEESTATGPTREEDDAVWEAGITEWQAEQGFAVAATAPHPFAPAPDAAYLCARCGSDEQSPAHVDARVDELVTLLTAESADDLPAAGDAS
jgi:hypothetical protein